MKSIRLNKNIRAQIVTNIERAYLAKTPAPVVPDILEDLKAAIAIWYMGKANKIMDKAIAAGLQEHMQTCANTDIYTNGSYFTYACFVDATGNSLKMPYLNPNSNVGVDLANTKDKTVKAIYAKYLAQKKELKPLKAAVQEHKNKLNAYMTDVTNVLDGVNTTAQLIDVWEECERFLPIGLINPSRIALPAVSIAALNKAL